MENKMNEQEFREKVNAFYERKDYRPVGVSVLYDDSKRFLLLQSAKCLDAWSFPQGGIDLNESLSQNLERELMEETGIVVTRDVIDIKWAYLFDTLDAESTRADKRGFTKGKAYFYTLAKYIGNKELVLQKEEVADARWATPEEAIILFEIGRPEKAKLSKGALELASRYLPILNSESRR